MQILKRGTISSVKTTAASLFLLVAAVVVVSAIVMTTRKVQVDPTLEAQTSDTSLAAEHPVKTPVRGRVSQICFSRGDSIYLRDVATGKDREVAAGSLPDLSPSGEEVAFMAGKQSEDIRVLEPPGAWRIAILNLRTNDMRDFPTLSNVYAWRPLWSHDGTRIAFQYFEAGNEYGGLHLGVLDTSTGTWKKINKSEMVEGGASLDAWVTGDQSLLLHGDQYFYEIGLDGAVVQKLLLDDLSKSGFSSNTRFSLSRDKRYLLFNRGVKIPMDEYQAAFIYDFVTKEVSQVTPNRIDAWRPTWIGSDNEVMFTCLLTRKKPYIINTCKIGVDGSSLTVLVPNADYASYAPRW